MPEDAPYQAPGLMTNLIDGEAIMMHNQDRIVDELNDPFRRAAFQRTRHHKTLAATQLHCVPSKVLKWFCLRPAFAKDT